MAFDSTDPRNNAKLAAVGAAAPPSLECCLLQWALVPVKVQSGLHLPRACQRHPSSALQVFSTEFKLATASSTSNSSESPARQRHTMNKIRAIQELNKREIENGMFVFCYAPHARWPNQANMVPELPKAHGTSTTGTQPSSTLAVFPTS
jgi:hypothetical protein